MQKRTVSIFIAILFLLVLLVGGELYWLKKIRKKNFLAGNGFVTDRVDRIIQEMREQIEHVTKSELLDQILTERKWLEEVLATLSPDQMFLPGTSGGWTVKDVLAHISAWERRMIHWTGSYLRGDWGCS
jgi:hypothetical protein